MRTILFAFILILGSWQNAFAQREDGPASERIKAYRVAVFSEIIELTPDEAAAFWPLYNEFDDKKRNLRKEYRPKKRAEAQTEAELKAQINAHFEYKQKDLDLEKAYSKKFQEVLPLVKVVKIPIAERRFKEVLVKKMGDRREKRKGHNN